MAAAIRSKEPAGKEREALTNSGATDDSIVIVFNPVKNQFLRIQAGSLKVTLKRLQIISRSQHLFANRIKRNPFATELFELLDSKWNGEVLFRRMAHVDALKVE